MRLICCILDVAVELTGPESMVGPLAAAYSRFVVPPDESATRPAVRVAYVKDDPPRIELGTKPIPVVDGIDPVVQLYQQFLTALLDRVRSHAVLHGASVVGPSGDGVLIAAPSGHGKSSLCLELLGRGYRFLGDDYAPLNLEESTIAPYPRAVAVALNGDAPVPEAFRSAAERPGQPQLLGKVLLDVAQVLGEDAVQGSPAPLRHVFVLSSESTIAPRNALPPTILDVASRLDARERLDSAFRAIPGVSVPVVRVLRNMATWRLRLDHSRNPTPALTTILEDEAILFLDKRWENRPDFTKQPQISRLRRREAAELLGRELLNRRTGEGVLSRYDGDTTALFLDLASALRHASCWRLRVGRFHETVDRIEAVTRTRS